MNDRKRNLIISILGGAAMFGVALDFLSSQKTTPTPIVTEPLSARANSPTSAFNAANPTPQPTPNPDKPLPLLGPHLREIGECLQITNSLNDDAVLSFTSLMDSLHPELGELITNDTDWKNVHITLPNGEKRRLRIEVEATSEEGSDLRLHYYGVDNEDLPVPMPLTEEQSKNPSEEYITSLENQGKVTLREEAHHGILSKGADIYYIERNGSLSEVELSYEGKSVKCQDLQSDHGTCNCF